MAFARFRHGGHQVPPSVRMILYGLEAAQDLTTTLRDLRRTVRLMQSGLVILFPDEVSGLQLLYSTLDRDLMQVERTCQFITLQLLTALAETPEDIVQLRHSAAQLVEESGSIDCTWSLPVQVP
jgi:hypothetical protein